ncbi:MAG: signal peptidase I [Treponema sp.]|nr:signal peptidase I [Treponema sp.]
MFDKWTQYNYRAQKYQQNRLLKIILAFLAFYIAYNCLTAFVVSVWVVENNSMQSGLSSGDRIVFASFESWLRIINDDPHPFKRGSIVLVDKGRNAERVLALRVIDGIVRFFTAQKISLFTGDGQYYIKRVIALPGDEISMVNYVFRVKTAGNSYSFTEFELSDKPYHPAIPQTPHLWDESLPFSGHMDPIVLGPDECFVVSDDRSNTNDSRTWGPVSPSMITAKALLRFWPVNKFEIF